MGRGQVVKAAGFDPATAGSTPAAPATVLPAFSPTDLNPQARLKSAWYNRDPT